MIRRWWNHSSKSAEKIRASRCLLHFISAMRLKYFSIFFLPTLTVFGIIKETVRYDANGGIIGWDFDRVCYIVRGSWQLYNCPRVCRRVTSSESEVKKCYRYTWMGPVTETTNQTSNCLDFQDGESGPTRPCFEPLVWTVNDEFGDHEPDLEELEAVCKEKGCDPFCTPSPSQTCVKYTEWNGDTLSYVSKVIIIWRLLGYLSHYQILGSKGRNY